MAPSNPLVEKPGGQGVHSAMASESAQLAALAQGAYADTCFPTDVYTRGFTQDFQLLKSFDVGGAQGSPLSPIIFPAAIDDGPLSTGQAHGHSGRY